LNSWAKVRRIDNIVQKTDLPKDLPSGLGGALGGFNPQRTVNTYYFMANSWQFMLKENTNYHE
jgi:hypothetical protein